MKSPIFLYVLLVTLFIAIAHTKADQTVTDAHKAIIKKYTDECLSAGHATPDLLQHLHEGKITNPDEQTKCFVKCFFEKLEFIADGKFNQDAVMQKLGPLVGEDNLKATIEKCKGIKGENICDIAYKANECFAGQHKFIF